jgi:hypothetical protein
MIYLGGSPSAVIDGMIAATADFEFVNDGRTVLVIENAQAAATTAIGFTFPNKDVGGVVYAASGVGDTVKAASKAIFGPFPTTLNNSSGKIVGTVGTLTTVYFGCLKF